MAVRNTRTGGARKCVAGEVKKGATPKKKMQPAATVADHLKGKPKTIPAKKPTNTINSVATKTTSNMNDQYKPATKKVDPKTPVAKPAVKKPVPTKQRPNQMDELSQSQMSKKRPTGSK